MIDLPSIQFTKNFLIKDILTIPNNISGIYCIYGNTGLLYIGKAKNVRQRLSQHISHSNLYSRDCLYGYESLLKYFNYSILNCPADREIYETYLINKMRPKLNKNKTYLYTTSRYETDYYPDELKMEDYSSFKKYEKSVEFFDL